jgi:hypothetical protein
MKASESRRRSGGDESQNCPGPVALTASARWATARRAHRLSAYRPLAPGV